MRYWEPVPRGPVLWEARAEPWATWVPLLCFVLHVISWLLIFSILLVFDYAELMGLKQVRLSDPYPRHLILSRIPLSPPRMSLCLPLSSTCLLFLSPSPPFLIRYSSPSPPSKAKNHGLLGSGKVHGPERRVRDSVSEGWFSVCYRRRVPRRGGKRQLSCNKGLSTFLSHSPSARCTTMCWGWASLWP